MTRENRKRVMAAVESLRGKVQPKSSADTIRRRVDAMVAELKATEPAGSERPTLIGALDEGARKLGGMGSVKVLFVGIAVLTASQKPTCGQPMIRTDSLAELVSALLAGPVWSP